MRSAFSSCLNLRQNMKDFRAMFAAMGLGAVLTTRWKNREPEVKPLLGLPDNYEAHAILPIGWPARKHGRGKQHERAHTDSSSEPGRKDPRAAAAENVNGEGSDCRRSRRPGQALSRRANR